MILVILILLAIGCNKETIQPIKEDSFLLCVNNLDKSEEVMTQTIATAEDEWMTEEFVPFTAVLEFTPSGSSQSSTLILEKDNPSDMRELDDQLEIPVIY